MEFHVQLVQSSPDLERIQDVLRDLDPAAVADTDPRGQRLRISSSLDAQELARVLRGTGLAVWEQDLIRQASICCGGCSG